MGRHKKRQDLRQGYGPKLVLDFGATAKELPKNMRGIRAPQDINEAPGGFLILDDDKEVSAKDFGYVVANFAYYGQVKYA
jgi:hypothetical protein